jgi:5-methylcytosine-specific restriction enzyme subunit McrC
MRVPVGNLYHIASYALDAVDWLVHMPVGLTVSAGVLDVLAHLLVAETERLGKRGLDRGYVEHEETLRSLRGRVLVGPSVARLLPQRLEAHCRFEELTVDIEVNRVVASVLDRLRRHPGVLANLRTRAGRLADAMDGVGRCSLVPQSFRRPELHRNNRHYRPVLDLCEILVHDAFPDREALSAQEWSVSAIDEEHRLMARLFEQFLRNYLDRHTPWAVGRRNWQWVGGGLDAVSQAVLPGMRTDITVEMPDRLLVIEAKYYLEPMIRHFSKVMLRSGHLYQLLAYLRRQAQETPNRVVEGVLVYAQVGDGFDYHFELEGHRVRAVSIDLTAPWPAVERAVVDLSREQSLVKWPGRAKQSAWGEG